MFSAIEESLRRLYLDDPRPWLVGFSGGKDSTLLASFIWEVVAAIPAERRMKPIAILCTNNPRRNSGDPRDGRRYPGSDARLRRARENLNIEVHLLRPPPEQSFWVNMIGRGYPAPNRLFR